MSITRGLTVSIASLAISMAVTAAPAFGQAQHVLVPAEKVQWGPAPPALPAGAQIAVLEGNPSAKGGRHAPSPISGQLQRPAALA